MTIKDVLLGAGAGIVLSLLSLLLPRPLLLVAVGFMVVWAVLSAVGMVLDRGAKRDKADADRLRRAVGIPDRGPS